MEIGTGTGYSGTVMVNLIGNGKLTTIEIDDVVAPSARRKLTRFFGTVKSSPAPPVIDWGHARSLRSLGGLAI